MRKQRRQRNGGFGEIHLAAPWAQTAPLTYVRREDMGGCGEVVASVTCPPRMRRWLGSEAGKEGRWQCSADIRYHDPQTGVTQHRIVHAPYATSVDAAAEQAILRADLEASKVRRLCRQDVRYPARYPGFSPELVWEEDKDPPPACKCEKKWTKRGYELSRACGRGFTMHVTRTGFSLRDPLDLRLKQRGELVWHGQRRPKPQGHDLRGREVWETSDDALKAGKRQLTCVLRTVCEDEESEAGSENPWVSAGR